MIRLVATGCYVPPDCPPPCDIEPRLVDEGIWTPADTRGFWKGTLMFGLGFALAWALIWAMR